MNWIDDVKNYREMSVPYENRELANEALNGFIKELGELRKKYRMKDVLTVMCVPVKYDDNETEALAIHQMGDAGRMEALSAYALGQLQGERKERINKLLTK